MQKNIQTLHFFQEEKQQQNINCQKLMQALFERHECSHHAGVYCCLYAVHEEWFILLRQDKKTQKKTPKQQKNPQTPNKNRLYLLCFTYTCLQNIVIIVLFSWIFTDRILYYFGCFSRSRSFHFVDYRQIINTWKYIACVGRIKIFGVYMNV